MTVKRKFLCKAFWGQKIWKYCLRSCRYFSVRPWQFHEKWVFFRLSLKGDTKSFTVLSLLTYSHFASLPKKRVKASATAYLGSTCLIQINLSQESTSSDFLENSICPIILGHTVSTPLSFTNSAAKETFLNLTDYELNVCKVYISTQSGRWTTLKTFSPIQCRCVQHDLNLMHIDLYCTSFNWVSDFGHRFMSCDWAVEYYQCSSLIRI